MPGITGPVRLPRWSDSAAGSAPRGTQDPAFNGLVANLSAISNCTTDCIFLLDGNWQLRYLNNRARSEMEQGRDLVGQSLWDAFPGAREGDFGGPFAEAMAKQVPQSFEGHYPPLGGWYDVQVVPIAGGLLVAFRNINERVASEQKLRESEERYRLAALATKDLIYDWDLLTDQVQWGEISKSHFGFDLEDLGNTLKWWEARVHEEDRARVHAHVSTAISERRDRLDIQYRWQRADGRYSPIHDRGYLMKNSSGEPVRVVGAIEDLSEEYEAQAEVAHVHNLLQTVIDSITDHIYVKDASGRFILVNRAAQASWDLAGRRMEDVFPAEISRAIANTDREIMTSGQAQSVEELAPFNEEMRTFQSMKVPWRQDGEIRGVIGISRDITDQKAIQESIKWAANHDALTALPNRALFQSCLSKLISDSTRANDDLSLLLLDVDHFKDVNDTLGHDVGDALLQAFADRLRSAVRPTDIVARLGGDEFAVILSKSGGAVASHVAHNIIASLCSPFFHEGRLLDCRASIGFSSFPLHGETSAELLKSADMALYAAKRDGRAQAKIFESSIRDDLQKHVSMLELGRDALRARQIFPYYQPKVDLRTGEVAGFEALLRWQHPRLGVRLPGTIAACFEDYTLASEISDRMIDCALADMRRWLDQGVKFGSVAVNVGAAEFRTGRFASSVLEQLLQSGVPTSCFQIEVTETVFLGRGAEYVERDLRLLSSAGVKVSLDDFGTGYASLRHLQQFPVDIIKIDRSFVADMLGRSGDAAIVRAVVNLGQSLGMKVVAEGVENKDQANELRRIGCSYGQGFLYSKAFAPSQMATFLKDFKGAESVQLSA